jgi:hypothetical protein
VVDDFLKAHPAFLHWRRSPHAAPAFTDAEALTIALMQGCLEVQSLKRTFLLIAANARGLSTSAF